MVAAFDHEELGSALPYAARPVRCWPTCSTRISDGLGAQSLDQQHRALARSFCLSADAGHAIHPNYPDRHDPANRPLLNAGPLLKINANQRYATDAGGARRSGGAPAAAAGVPTQEFVSNNAMPCGSTIGPLTATRLGIATVDVGHPPAVHALGPRAGRRGRPARPGPRDDGFLAGEAEDAATA